eukprot:Phypoly_transcript_16322.p1 GENE.Phypoly_transcript_16322~~Phypoly_transcript_16322.p1  ORF type:complete len:268 (+),score=39.51 Phypoly_transcript_16322:37-804(+)
MAMDYATDIKKLMHKYEQQGDISFKSFRQLWKQLKLSRVHQENVESDSAEYIHACFYHFLSFLFVEAPLIVRVGVVYGIYLLYFTQPLSPKAKLTVTTTVWVPFKAVIDDMKTSRIADGYQCYRKLLDDGAIYFSAVLNPAAALVHIDGEEAQGVGSPEAEEGESSNSNAHEMDTEPSRGSFTAGGGGAATSSFIDMATLENIAKHYAAAKHGCVTDSTAPASLSLDANLPQDLKMILDDFRQRKAALHEPREDT